VRLGLKTLAPVLELGPQLAVVLDDAVMDDRDLGRRDRVRVALVRSAMRRPARVGDADRAQQRLGGKPLSESVHFALGTPALDASTRQRCDPSAVIAAVLQPAQPLEKNGRGLAPSDDSNNAAHLNAS